MADLWLQRHGNSLVGADSDSNAVIAKMAFGKLFRAEVVSPRSGKQHRLYWSLCRRIAEAIGSQSENVSDVLKIETGHCEVIRTKSHGELRLPRSIAFFKLDQEGFSEFFKRCVAIIETEWGIARPDILAAVEELLTPEEWRDVLHPARTKETA